MTEKLSEQKLSEQAEEWLEVSAHPNWCLQLLAANEQCDCGLQLVVGLLADNAALEQRVERLEEIERAAHMVIDTELEDANAVAWLMEALASQEEA